MILNKIALATLSAPLTLGVNYIDQNTQNKYTSISNIYTETDYDQNDELETYNQYETTQFSQGYIGAQFTTKARSIITIGRYLAEHQYIYRQYILIQYDNDANLSLERILYKVDLNIPNNDKVDTINASMSYINTLTQTQEDFLNGANYNNYDEIKNAYLGLNTGATSIGAMSISNNEARMQTEQNNVLIQLIIEYDFDLITDTGAFMTNMNVMKNIDETITYEQPENVNYEVVDIAGIMYEVIGMPFAWISIALNFTIFPNTPYALNISHLILAIVVSCIAIFIIKRILN